MVDTRGEVALEAENMVDKRGSSLRGWKYGGYTRGEVALEAENMVDTRGEVALEAFRQCSEWVIVA
jgi:hypothetical protein